MADGAVKWIFIAALALVLPGCTSWRLALLNARLDPAAAHPPVDAQTQRQLDRLLAQGAAALARNDLDACIAAWRRYAAAAPVYQAQARKLRGYLSLLQRESAKRFAHQAVAGERSAPFVPGDRLHVALFPFRNEAPDPQRPAPGSFNRAVVAMITTDLAQVPALTVLERERIDALQQELRLAGSGLVDAQGLDAQGRILGAGTVVAGSVYNQAGPAGPGSGRYKINAAVSEVQGGSVVGVQEAEGRQADFQRLEKRIVHGILEALQISEVPAGVDKIHTESWEAYAQFAAGLKALAEDRFDSARKAFRAALAFDPGFDMAEEAFLNTPEQAVTLDQMRAEFPPPSAPAER